MTRYEQRLQIGELVRSMRKSAGLSQEATAAEMDVGRTTVVRWEAGEGEFIRNILEWKHFCEVTRSDLIKSTLLLIAPEMYDVKDGSITDKKKALTEYLYEAAPNIITEILYYVFFGPHGSVPEAVIQMLGANMHTPLYMRHTVSQTVSTNYKQAQRMSLDPCPDWPQPDIALLDAANNAGLAASMAGKDVYHLACKEM